MCSARLREVGRRAVEREKLGRCHHPETLAITVSVVDRAWEAWGETGRGERLVFDFRCGCFTTRRARVNGEAFVVGIGLSLLMGGAGLTGFTTKGWSAQGDSLAQDEVRVGAPALEDKLGRVLLTAVDCMIFVGWGCGEERASGSVRMPAPKR